VLAAALVVGAVGAGHAQEFRFRSTTTARYMQLRTLTYDSAVGGYTGGRATSAMPITQDLEVNVWGLGVQGLRAYALVRFREELGDDGYGWPRSEDRFDALWGFLELERDRYRLRLGRLQRASGLGVYGFDGALATLRPLPNVRLEAYGGRGLARGLLDSYASSAISIADPVIPETGSILAGASFWMAPSAGSSVTAAYQREITDDRDGLISERVALDAAVPLGRRVRLSGYADAELATREWGRARLTGQVHLPRGMRLELAAFRHKPVFGLNTIWGVFSPQAYRGMSISADVPAGEGVELSAGWQRRTYEPTTETTPWAPELEDRTDFLTAGVQLVSGDYQFSGTYQYVAGYGGGESGGEAELAYDRGGIWHAGVVGVAFQEAEEFRVATGTVLGIGFNGRARLGRALAVRGSVLNYWHTGTKGANVPDWSQLRVHLGVDITFGASADRLAGGAR
jgi:hypothetical protein